MSICSRDIELRTEARPEEDAGNHIDSFAIGDNRGRGLRGSLEVENAL